MSSIQQHDALMAARSQRPRGLNTGDVLSYGDKSFTVMALQQWAVDDKRSHAVGLVWVADCTKCGSRWAQLTNTWPASLSEYCDACVGGRIEDTVDAGVAQHLAETADHAKPKGAGKRRGHIETLIIDVRSRIAQSSPVTFEQLLRETVRHLPEPAEGRRDTRRQSVARALAAMGKERDGPLMFGNGAVTLAPPKSIRGG